MASIALGWTTCLPWSPLLKEEAQLVQALLCYSRTSEQPRVSRKGVLESTLRGNPSNFSAKCFPTHGLFQPRYREHRHPQHTGGKAELCEQVDIVRIVQFLLNLPAPPSNTL